MHSDSPESAKVLCTERKLEEGVSSETAVSCHFVNAAFELVIAPAEDQMDEQELESQLCCDYLATTQADAGMTRSQRATVVDSMITITERIGLSNDTLFMAVACLDRYLAATPVPLPLLQPVSIACLWIASKYEDLSSIPAKVFAPFMIGPEGLSLGCDVQAVQLLVKLEAGILQALDYRLASIVTVKVFKHKIIQRLWSEADAVIRLTQQQHQQLYAMVSYLTEVCLLEYQLLKWPPSMQAAAAYAVAHLLLGIHLDKNLLLKISGYACKDLGVVMQYLCSLHTTLYQALLGGVPYSVTRKYCAASLHGVAAVPPLGACDPRLSV